MTEKQKRELGLLHNANYDPTIQAEIVKAKDICFEYNNILPSKQEERIALLAKLFGKMGSILAVQSPFYCDFGYNIEVGENFYANHGLIILDGARVIFGDNVFIGPNCCFYTAGHPIDFERRNEGLEFAHPITVGNNVWFGGNVVVLPNVTIGNNVIIGAGSVVTKNIPDNVIAVGNPCKVLREISEADLRKEYGLVKDFV